MSCIALPDELVFVDCGAIAENARQFHSDMEERFGRPATHLFLTDVFWFNIWGIEAFKDANVVASSPGRSYYRKNLKDDFYIRWKEHILSQVPDDENLRESLLKAPLFIPSIGILKQKTFGSKFCPVIFKTAFYRTRRAATVSVPSEKTLFTGGNLSSCYVQTIWFSPGYVDQLVEWEKIDIEQIIPGHGFIVDKSFISLIREYSQDLYRMLREMKKQELTENQVLESTLPEYPSEKLKGWVVGSPQNSDVTKATIRRIYKEALKDPNEEDLMFIS